MNGGNAPRPGPYDNVFCVEKWVEVDYGSLPGPVVMPDEDEPRLFVDERVNPAPLWGTPAQLRAMEKIAHDFGLTKEDAAWPRAVSESALMSLDDVSVLVDEACLIPIDSTIATKNQVVLSKVDADDAPVVAVPIQVVEEKYPDTPSAPPPTPPVRVAEAVEAKASMEMDDISPPASPRGALLVRAPRGGRPVVGAVAVATVLSCLLAVSVASLLGHGDLPSHVSALGSDFRTLPLCMDVACAPCELAHVPRYGRSDCGSPYDSIDGGFWRHRERCSDAVCEDRPPLHELSGCPAAKRDNGSSVGALFWVCSQPMGNQRGQLNKMPGKKKGKKIVKIVKKVSVKRGKIKGHGGYFANIGSGLGGALGGVADGIMDVGSRISGFGDYRVKRNTVADNTAGPPTFAGDGGIRINHREFIGDVSSPGSAFNLVQYSINPGLAASFPFLSTLTSAFEQYDIEGMVYEFKSTSGTAVGSTNTALGVVIMATNYDVLDPPFASKVEMEAYQFATSTVPSASVLHAIECARDKSAMPISYVRTNTAPSNSDLRMYDHGLFQIATQGQQAACVIGELWVTYSVKLMKPKLSSPIVDRIACVDVTSNTFTSGAKPTTLASYYAGSTFVVGYNGAGTLTVPYTGRYVFGAYLFTPNALLTNPDFTFGAGAAAVAGGWSNKVSGSSGGGSWDIILDITVAGASVIMPTCTWTSGNGQWYIMLSRTNDGLGMTAPLDTNRVRRRVPRLGMPGWISLPPAAPAAPVDDGISSCGVLIVEEEKVSGAGGVPAPVDQPRRR